MITNNNKNTTTPQYYLFNVYIVKHIYNDYNYKKQYKRFHVIIKKTKMFKPHKHIL